MKNTLSPNFFLLFISLASLFFACNKTPKQVKPSFSKNYTFVIQDVMATAKFANADVKVLPVTNATEKDLVKADISITLYNSRNLPNSESGLDSLARRAIKIFAEPIVNRNDFKRIIVCFQQEDQFPKIEAGKRCEYEFPLTTVVGP